MIFLPSPGIPREGLGVRAAQTATGRTALTPGPSPGVPGEGRILGGRCLLVYFSLTLFVSAMLLFLVQPMIGKMILPNLGGSPSVWNACMVFFQAMLLVGYGYAHLLTKYQPLRAQVVIQAVVLLSAFVVLPFAVGAWEPPSDANPILPLMGKLCVLAGLPYFAVATTAPLLQRWFAHTGHAAATDPYFLYAASNLGSMLGLVLYPLVVEPWLPVTPAQGENTLATQVHLWTGAFALLVGLVLGCGIVVWKSPALQPTPTATPMPTPALTLWRRLRWIALAAVPSSLMLGVTTHITTDVAATAFFWILPLAVYLLTFIIAFARWPIVWTGKPHRVLLYVQPCLIVILLIRMLGRPLAPMWADFGLHLAMLFSTALLCHGELAKDRPAPVHLTEFYFWISAASSAACSTPWSRRSSSSTASGNIRSPSCSPACCGPA